MLTAITEILKSAAQGFEVTGILVLQIRNEFVVSLTGAPFTGLSLFQSRRGQNELRLNW